MSAIKTHELFDIVDGDDIVFKDSEGEDQILKVKSLMVERSRPSFCQIFTEKENMGSMARETKCFNAKIQLIKPETSYTEFEIKTKVNNDFQNLKLKTVKSESSECIIS